jgi:hypothetical protein
MSLCTKADGALLAMAAHHMGCDVEGLVNKSSESVVLGYVRSMRTVYIDGEASEDLVATIMPACAVESLVAWRGALGPKEKMTRCMVVNIFDAWGLDFTTLKRPEICDGGIDLWWRQEASP